MEIEDKLRIKAESYFEVGELLKSEYDGDYDRPSIEEFFDAKAEELLLKAGKLENTKKDG
jgi:hypothetical protein